MEWWIWGLWIFSVFFVLLVTNMPVAFVFGLLNMSALIVYSGGQLGILSLLASSAYESVSTLQYSAIPLFTLMGGVLYETGLVEMMYLGLGRIIGKVPGRLAVIGVAAGTVFGAASGSSTASVATIGSSLGPEMTKRRYSKWLAFGSITATGGLAAVIPPSNLMIIFGGVAGLPIGQLLIGGLVPGLLMAFLITVFIVVVAVVWPGVAPEYEIEGGRGLAEQLRTLADFVPVALVITSVLGSIFVGLATPSEAAAVGALAAFLLSGIYGRLTVTAVKRAVMSSLNITCLAFLIITTALVFSQVLALTGIASGLTRAFVGLSVEPLIVMLLMNLVVLVMGMMMDPVSIILVIVPIFMPIAVELEFDVMWWALIMMVNIEIALISPPFGLNLFVAQGIAPEGTSLTDIYRWVIPFVLIEVVVIAIMILWPPLTTWLPNLVG